MIRALFTALFACYVVLVGTSCSSSHVLPCLKPVFAGLDESKVPAAARHQLSKAKQDFRCVRVCGQACYARDCGRIPHTNSRKFVGDGYEITQVDSWAGFVHRHGPQIVIQPCITGGRIYRYDEVEISND